MAERVMLLDELRDQSIQAVLEKVAEGGEQVIVRLPGGQQIVIAPQPQLTLKPLPVLEGYVPEGWKDALYPAG